MPGLCEGHVTQRTVTGQGIDTEMGAALGTCGVWTLTHGPGIKYSCSIEQHQNVQCQYTLLCYSKLCEQLHFHTSDVVLQFLHNPSKTGDKDIDLQS